MRLPLLFTFSQLVFGNGFIAGVRLNGHAILEEDWGETWITGVAPTGFAGGGKDRATALVDFRQTWASVLFDIASEADSFLSFKEQCEAFLRSHAEALDAEWDTALAHVRANKYVDASLPSVPADTRPPTFEVCELQPAQSEPEKNVPVVELATAA